MNTDLFRDAIDGRAHVVPITVGQYHQMIEHGVLEEGAPIELLDGVLVFKERGGKRGDVTVNPKHGLVVTKIMGIAPAVAARHHHLLIQQPITIPPDQEPEPDAAVVRGEPDDYSDRHPGPGDVTAVIEVAESSLERDRKTKQRIYAKAGIPQYLIVNLTERVIEVYEEPNVEAGRYDRMERVSVGGAIALRLGDGRVEVSARTWLP